MTKQQIAILIVLCVLILGTLPLISSAATNGSLSPWQATTSLTAPRFCFAVAHTDRHLYVVGGATSANNTLSIVERAEINPDGSLGPWQAMTSMTTGRRNLAAVQANGYLYALGGTDGGSNLSSVEWAAINPDGSLGSWQVTSSMTVERHGLTVVSADDYLYALGGDYDGTVERAVINPDGSLGSWQATTSMITKRVWFAAVAVDNYLYAMGGQPPAGGLPLSSVERAMVNPDGSLGTWEIMEAMAAPRCALGAVAASGYIHAFGGGTFTNQGGLDLITYDSVEWAVINPDGSLGPWKIGSWMTTERRSFAATGVGRYLYALGGTNAPYDGPLTLLDSVERAKILYIIYLPVIQKEHCHCHTQE